jgi:methenyltetrahydromethanopterin cyclohydrolase
MLKHQDALKVAVERSPEGSTIIDTGITVQGGYLTGKYITEICMGGLGKTSFTSTFYDDLPLPTIVVTTDYPRIALLGSQLAGWSIKVEEYTALGSGPARALALKPKKLFMKIDYKDTSNIAIIVLETSKKPDTQVINYIATKCQVPTENLYLFLTPTSSLTGFTQISGRIVESGLHKLVEVGFNPKNVLAGFGYAPIAPLHPNLTKAMGRTNDMILYGGVASFTVSWDDDQFLRELIKQIPSSASKDYGKPFCEIFKEANHNFYNIDPALFAPAVVMVNNVKTGSFIKEGYVNVDIIKRSITS